MIFYLTIALITQVSDVETLVPRASTIRQPPGCPAHCECDENLSSTVCSRRNLSEIPQVPVTSLYVYVDRNPFTNPVLSHSNFSNIPYVRGLYLRGCGIETIHGDTFRNLKFIRELDLSHNKISLLPRGVFANVQLDFLDLGFNPGIKLLPDSFCGTSITRLSLKCCDLTSIDVQTFHPLLDSITSLTLSCNDFPTIPASLVWSPKYLSDLNIGENYRLTCDCNMVWISRRISVQKRIKVDYLPKDCTAETLSVLSESDPGLDANCTTEAVMLKDIDYGLCVRSLELIKTSSTTASTIGTNSTTWSQSIPEFTTRSAFPELQLFRKPVALEFSATLVNNSPVCNFSQTAPLTHFSNVKVENSITFTRTHMFIACVATATFTFVSAVMCYFANRLCFTWFNEYRRKVSTQNNEWPRNDTGNSNAFSTSSQHQQVVEIDSALPITHYPHPYRQPLVYGARSPTISKAQTAEYMYEASEPLYSGLHVSKSMDGNKQAMEVRVEVNK